MIDYQWKLSSLILYYINSINVLFSLSSFVTFTLASPGEIGMQATPLLTAYARTIRKQSTKRPVVISDSDVRGETLDVAQCM